MPGTALDSLIDRALAEDVGDGDLTTDAIVPAGARGRGAVVVRSRAWSAASTAPSR